MCAIVNGLQDVWWEKKNLESLRMRGEHNQDLRLGLDSRRRKKEVIVMRNVQK